MRRIGFVAVLGLVLMVFWYGCSKSSTEPASPSGGGNVNEAEPNDLTPQALGGLGSSDYTVTGVTSSGTDVDRFSVTLSATTNFLAKVSWQGTGDLDLAIKNGNGISLTLRDTGTNPESCLLASSPPGTYVVEVTSKQTGATSYTLTIGPR
jgi:hypothetical protein